MTDVCSMFKLFYRRHKILQLVTKLLNRRGGPLFPFALCTCGCFVRILSFRIWGGLMPLQLLLLDLFTGFFSSSARFFFAREQKKENGKEETTSSGLRSFGAHVRTRDKESSRHPVTYMRRAGRRGMSSKRKRAWANTLLCVFSFSSRYQ